MRATSIEEQVVAPTAKKAKREEQIRVRARDGEEVTLLRDAARLMGTLKDLMDLATSEDGIYPMPTITASTLQMVCKLNDPDYTWPSSDEPSLFQLFQLIEDALYIDAPIALKHIQRAIASQLNGKRAPELCALVGAGGDFDSAEEHAPPHVEPAFVPEGVEAPQQPASSTLPPEPLQQPSFSADAMEAALGLVDVATLAELKGVTRSWRTLAQRVLCSRLCRRDGQPVPTRLDEITDLDVEQLIEAGRPGDAAVAGRMLPGLSRLHGFGYVVDVAAVRAANLQCGMGGGMGGMGMNPATIAALIGYVGAGGMGMNPAMIAAQMGVIGAGGMPLANPMMGGAMGDWRRHPSLLHGAAKDALNICISGEGEPPLRLTIAAVACAGSGVICGIPVQQLREDSVTELNLSDRGLHVPAAMLVAYLIPATSGLKNCNLLKNRFDVELAKKLAKMGMEKGIMLSGMTCDQTEADFSHQSLKPADSILIASDLQFMAALTELTLWSNNIGDDGAKAIAEALKVNVVLTELRLGGNTIGNEGAKAIAEALKVNTVVTELNLGLNFIGDIGAKAIAEALKVNAVLTTLGLFNNSIGNDGANAIAEALKVNAVLTILDLQINKIGDLGAKAISESLKVNAVLTKLWLNNNKIGDKGKQAVWVVVKDRSGFKLHF